MFEPLSSEVELFKLVEEFDGKVYGGYLRDVIAGEVPSNDMPTVRASSNPSFTFPR